MSILPSQVPILGVPIFTGANTRGANFWRPEAAREAGGRRPAPGAKLPGRAGYPAAYCSHPKKCPGPSVAGNVSLRVQGCRTTRSQPGALPLGTMVDLGGGSGRLPAIVANCLISINMVEKLLKNVDFGGFLDIAPRELVRVPQNPLPIDRATQALQLCHR